MEYKKNCLMEIYTNQEDSFSVGFYLFSFNEYSLFHLLDDQGKSDGVYLIRDNLVEKINYDTEYLRKICLYVEYWNTEPSKDVFQITSGLENILTIEDCLEYIKDNGLLSSFKMNQEDYLVTGYIEDIDQFNVKINAIDIETAKEFEEVIILKRDILILEIDSVDNRLLNYAYMNHY